MFLVPDTSIPSMHLLRPKPVHARFAAAKAQPNMGPQSSDLYTNNHYTVANQSSIQSNSFPVKPWEHKLSPPSVSLSILPPTDQPSCLHTWKTWKRITDSPPSIDLLLHPKTFLLATSICFTVCVLKHIDTFQSLVVCLFLPRTISLCWSLGSNFRC